MRKNFVLLIAFVLLFGISSAATAQAENNWGNDYQKKFNGLSYQNQEAWGSDRVNQASIIQNGNKNFSSIIQKGISNYASVTQIGDSNSAIIKQFSDNNLAVIKQSGSNNRAVIVQD